MVKKFVILFISNEVLKKGSAALTLFALILSCIVSSVKESLEIDILSLGVFFCYWSLLMLADSFQSISYTRKSKVENKYSKSFFKSFKLGFELVALSKALYVFFSKMTQFIIIA